MIRSFLLLRLVGCLFSFCPCFLAGQTTDTLLPPLSPEEREMFITWERMPTIRSCDSLESHAARVGCSGQVIMGLLAENLRWPAGGCAEGTVVISFTVEADGALNDFRVGRGFSPAFDEEALRVVRLMARQTEPWHPGTQGRKREPTRILYHVPVRFKLE